MRKKWPILLLFSLLLSCADYTPKPKGYFRIEPPKPAYQVLSIKELPYTFDASVISIVELPPVGDPAEWINIAYPSLNAKIYCSYLPISSRSFYEVDRESRELAERQSRKSNIIEYAFSNPDERVYGALFEIEGSVASPVQFLLTDSVSHFFRGSLYLESSANADSIAPVIEYITEDIFKIIQTFHWTK